MKHADIVLLGLLREAPRHGYEIDREIGLRQYRQWARISRSTIYAALDRLAKQGHVKVSTENVGARPPRKVFALTGSGRNRLSKLTEEALSSPRPTYSDRVLGLLFATASHNERVRHQLYNALGTIERDLKDLAAGRPDGPDEMADILYQFRRAVLHAERKALHRGTELLVR